MTLPHLLQAVAAKVSGPNLVALGLFWISVIAAVVVSYVNSGLPRTWRGLWRHAFPPGLLAHPSARADLLFVVSGKFVNLLMAAPTALAVLVVGDAVQRTLQYLLPFQPAAAGPIGTPTLLLFSVTMFLGYDLSYYIYHNAQHRVPILWELHKVHHSAEVMVGLTKDRVHPLDSFMNHVWDGLVIGLIYGVWLFFVRDPVELTFFGINIYVLRNILMMDFTRHTHLKISFGATLNKVIICPHYHQLHHSVAPEHWDKNFGLMLSVWDRLFGTFAVPKPNEDFNFGLPDNEHCAYRSCLRLYIVPLVRMSQMAHGWLGARVLANRSGITNKS